MLLVAVVGCGLSVAGPGCAVPGGLDSHAQRIIDGEVSGDEDDAVILLALTGSFGNFQGMCTGTLIAPNLVLTARHCVSAVDDGGIACDEDGNALAGGYVYEDKEPGSIEVFAGTDLHFTPDAKGVQIFHNDADNLCNNDIALVLLDKKLDKWPIAQLRLDGPPVEGDTITSVGWGVTNSSSSGHQFKRMRRTDVEIVGVGPVSGRQVGGAVSPNEFSVGESICQGDSGGPAFAGNSKTVVGVVSRGGNGRPYDPNTSAPYTQCVDAGGYRTFNLYTRVDGFRDLINQAFQAAGTEPWLEGGPDPRKAKFGEACAGADACRSALCVGQTAPFCSQQCDGTPGSCPDGFSCRNDSSLGASVCLPASSDGGSSCAVAMGGRGKAPTPLWLVTVVGLAAVPLLSRRRAGRGLGASLRS